MDWFTGKQLLFLCFILSLSAAISFGIVLFHVKQITKNVNKMLGHHAVFGKAFDKISNDGNSILEIYNEMNNKIKGDA